MLTEVLLQTFGPKAFTRALMRSEHLGFQSDFLPRAQRWRVLAPRVMAAHGNAQHLAHRRHRTILSHRLDHVVLHRDSFKVRREFLLAKRAPSLLRPVPA
jgi:hypothetical protein